MQDKLRLAELDVFLKKESSVDTQIAQEKYGEDYQEIINKKIGAEVEKIKEANKLASANEVIASIDFSPKSRKFENKEIEVVDFDRQKSQSIKDSTNEESIKVSSKPIVMQNLPEDLFAKRIKEERQEDKNTQTTLLEFVKNEILEEKDIQSAEQDKVKESNIDNLQNIVNKAFEEVSIQLSDFKKDQDIYQKVEILKENQDNIKKAKRSRALF